MIKKVIEATPDGRTEKTKSALFDQGPLEDAGEDSPDGQVGGIVQIQRVTVEVRTRKTPRCFQLLPRNLSGIRL